MQVRLTHHTARICPHIKNMREGQDNIMYIFSSTPRPYGWTRRHLPEELVQQLKIARNETD